MGNEEMVHWWQGYVVVRVQGHRLERLINRMMNHRFAAWNISRTSKEDAQFSITIQDFFQLRPILRETDCRVSIVKRVGLPFILQKAQKRSGFILGAFLFCVFLYLFSNMIWSVDIEGVKLPEDEALLRAELVQLGVKPGGFKFRAENGTIIQQTIMDHLPNITWIGFQYEGTKAQLKVVEKALPQLPEPTNPRHIVANKKAVIHDLFVEQGEPRVKPNQYVQPGDILISGIIGTEENQQIVSAKGDVIGEIWYEGNVSIPLTQRQTALTGEQVKRFFISLGDYHLPIWGFKQASFEQMREERVYQPVVLWRWELPIGLTSIAKQESKEVKRNLSEDEAIRLGLTMAKKNMESKLPTDAEIIGEKVLRKRIENGKVYIKIHLTVLESIISEQLIFQGD